MGRKSKAFISKKDAHRFVLMHRSQQDPEYHREGGSKLVLHPANAATARALQRLGMGSALAYGEGDGEEHGDGDGDGDGEGAKATGTATATAGTGGLEALTAGGHISREHVERGRLRELREVDEVGLPLDGYDYSKHLAPISTGGTFVPWGGADAGASAPKGSSLFSLKEDESASGPAAPAPGLAPAPTPAPAAQARRGIALPEGVLASTKEYDRMLEAITLRADRHMDRDLRIALEEECNDANGAGAGAGTPGGGARPGEEVEELDDDFMAQLMQAEAEAPGEDHFDYEKHVAQLMARAERQDRRGGVKFADELNDSDFDFEDSDEDGEHGHGLGRENESEHVTHMHNAQDILDRATQSREARDIDVHFDLMLAKEYDDDDIGELDHGEYDGRVAGQVELTSDQMQQLVQYYLKDREEDLQRPHEIGATAENVETREKAAAAHAANEADAEALANSGETADQALARDMALRPDSEQLLQHFGYDTKPRESWDCETIVSTYSVHDNHPTVISVPGTGRRRPRRHNPDADSNADADADAGFEEAASVVPLPAMAHVMTGAQRPKEETAQEKKMRKAMTKMHQRMRRQEKKSTRLMFKSERNKQDTEDAKHKAAAAPPRGLSTFRF